MADPNAAPPTDTAPRGFPFVTAAATVVVLFLFVGVTLWVTGEKNPLGDAKAEPRVDPQERVEELRAKNQAVLDGKPGSGAKMSVDAATGELLGSLKGPKDTLPFPVPAAK